jgi:hypothetical protein
VERAFELHGTTRSRYNSVKEKEPELSISKRLAQAKNAGAKKSEPQAVYPRYAPYPAKGKQTSKGAKDFRPSRGYKGSKY